MQEKLHAMLVEQFSYPAEWLEARKAQVRSSPLAFVWSRGFSGAGVFAQFVKGQLSYDKHMGFEPYD